MRTTQLCIVLSLCLMAAPAELLAANVVTDPHDFVQRAASLIEDGKFSEAADLVMPLHPSQRPAKGSPAGESLLAPWWPLSVADFDSLVNTSNQLLSRNLLRPRQYPRAFHLQMNGYVRAMSANPDAARKAQLYREWSQVRLRYLREVRDNWSPGKRWADLDKFISNGVERRSGPRAIQQAPDPDEGCPFRKP